MIKLFYLLLFILIYKSNNHVSNAAVIQPIVVCNGNGKLDSKDSSTCICDNEYIFDQCEYCSCICPEDEICPDGCTDCVSEVLSRGCKCSLNYNCLNESVCDDQIDYELLSVGVCDNGIIPVTCSKSCTQKTSECKSCKDGYYESLNSDQKKVCLPCPNCQNGGQCNESGTYTCINDWLGDLCQYSSATTCFDNGLADNYGICNCKVGFDPATNCETCLEGYFGASCTTVFVQMKVHVMN